MSNVLTFIGMLAIVFLVGFFAGSLLTPPDLKPYETVAKGER